MNPFPWISFETSPGENKLTYHEIAACDTGSSLENNCRPSFVTFVGKRSKAILLDSLLGGDVSVPVHKEVYLWSSARLRSGCAPLLIIDCGIQNPHLHPPNPALAQSSRPATSWLISKAININTTLCGRIFSPFSSVICCFVSDLGGPKAVAKWLASQATTLTASGLPTVPRILLVVETTSDTFDERIAANKAAILLFQAMQNMRSYQDPLNIQRDIKRQFGEIEVLGLHASKSTGVRARALKRRVLAMSEASMQERANTFTQFSFKHFQTLTKQAIGSLSSDASFHFSSASRPHGFSTELLEACLVDFLSQLPSQAWLWHFAAPIIASALLLASYPPNAHTAISSHTAHEDIQLKFLSATLHEFHDVFTLYNSGKSSASEVHRQILSTHHPHLANLKSHRSCFCCLLRMPEKVLACGHALCDPCIKIFGRRSHSEKNTYDISECVLCGVSYQNSTFRFVPPTAGIRVLSLDGGGVRGVVPLMFLEHLDNSLAPLGCSVKDHFDFVCGTSAGGLVVIGMFLLQWGATESIQRFEQVAGKTFGNKRKVMLARTLQLLVAYLEDGQYSLTAVQEAFRITLDSPIQMFNPLRNDTKVAVTTTAVHDCLPWLFTNYNGGMRPDDLGYDVVRAEKAHNDITVSDAACCTSAAPWFFKPQAIRTLGIFQDGGLQHNNPANIAQWEARFIWPSKVDPDFFLSLGTGTSSASASFGPPTSLRFYRRLFRSFERSLDGEDAWKRFYNSIALSLRPRYHRLNVRFTGTEPRLDDVLQIPSLKASVLEVVQEDKIAVTAVLDAMIASMFYFELDELPQLENGDYMCTGYIFCRLDIPKEGLRHLYSQLLDTTSWFLIQGTPVRCVQSVPKGLPPFKRRITFRAESVDELIAFSIRGITSTPKLLSGFPTTLAKLIEDQMLISPFGTINHVSNEKPLPALPKKRCSISRPRQSKRGTKRVRFQTRCSSEIAVYRCE
ncbi:FabD/lysophospholipase-like protein [Cucurbitaria berberidis CBS 394.84]|uniref:FabD/lysophospholipase-like protein n=1 Tax=Cucurbitaria berberidis CBS 394.84 TaxID=1168544 RepID=A0A9P4G711_9PLEO|nr:FabD/lysophospholipase-like protein [Cucurbitaria berberidis CBS 394.84]KAF1840101.1 FabD/lysophospholipase-like protein [Cucurbitaria berberidis CBS 394.84]